MLPEVRKAEQICHLSKERADTEITNDAIDIVMDVISAVTIDEDANDEPVQSSSVCN